MVPFLVTSIQEEDCTFKNVKIMAIESENGIQMQHNSPFEMQIALMTKSIDGKADGP